MKAPTLILGAGGRLGAALVREWRHAGDEVLPLTRQQLDLSDLAALRSALAGLDFSSVVNCAALTNVDYCETHPEEAFRINGQAVGIIGEEARKKGARCLHISTDYVFDGEKRAPYLESDSAQPISVYGSSKRAGEEALLAASAGHLAIRVSWVFGPDRPSFVDQILQRACAQADAAAIADKWAAPTYTLEIATLLRPFLRPGSAGGILHLANAGACTWQEYGQFALDTAASLGAPLLARSVAPLAMKDLEAFVARRPVYTVLACDRLKALTREAPSPWQDAVARYIRAYRPYEKR